MYTLDNSVSSLTTYMYGTSGNSMVTCISFCQKQKFYRISVWLSRDPIEEDGGINIYGFVNNNPINDFDVVGLSIWDSRVADWFVCMGDCVQDNDPLEYVAQKVALSLTGMTVPKTLVAKMARIAGDEQLARITLASLKHPGISRFTTFPDSIAASLRASGKASQFLHGFGAGMNVFFTSYGIYMVQVESACMGYCCGSRYYTENSDIWLPVDINKLAGKAVTAIDSIVNSWIE